ncbi:HEAT repeat domain-containing protein [Nonomuraea typhae]|uniref:HEAT repeat domain-containing protein n=1 Tax=Nonomuraea typhae TaxID=2603600 RepID=UPI0012F7B52B|nr:HEAT repeat domain-containing protein [Nonomuraea typhae]
MTSELPDQVTAILQGLRDAGPRATPALAGEELAQLGPGVVPRLIEALAAKEANPQVILQALARLGESAAAARACVADLVADTGQPTIVRCAAALCLGRIGDEKDTATLGDAAREPEAALRGCAYRALGTIAAGEGLLAPLLGDEPDEVAALELVGALARMTRPGTGAARDALEKAAGRHRYPAVRRAAADALSS